MRVGYPVITFGLVPALFFAGPSELGCDDCPENLLLIDRDPGLASFGMALGVVLYALLLIAVLARTTVQACGAATPEERLQLDPGLRVRAADVRARDGRARRARATRPSGRRSSRPRCSRSRSSAACCARHVSHLDAELRESLEELRASRARLVEAGDAERRRLERDLHDGAQSRLVALAMLLRTAQRAGRRTTRSSPALLDRAQEELQTSLAELRELARGIHPAVLTERGLEPALRTLVARAPVPVEVEADVGRAAARAGRVRRLLRRLRGARQRREVRAGDRGERDRAAAATGA